MPSFLAILFTLRIGLAPGPESAIASIRETTLAVAEDVAERDRFVAREQEIVVSSSMRILSSGVRRAAASGTVSNGWRAPPLVEVLRKEDWRDALEDVLDNQTIANAVMWVASAPLRLNVAPERVFVAISLRTP